MGRRVFLIMVLFSSVLVRSAGDEQSTGINASNWMNHPKIAEIRAVYSETEDALQGGELEQKTRIFDHAEPYFPTLKTIAFDKNAVARKYTEEAGSDDSAATTSFYYDSQKRLRFVFITGGAVNGSEFEHRIYFDAAQQRIWEIQKYLKGPGYTFPAVWPKSAIVIDAWKAFSLTTKGKPAETAAPPTVAKVKWGFIYRSKQAEGVEYPYTDIRLLVNDKPVQIGSYMGHAAEAVHPAAMKFPADAILGCRSYYAGGGDDVCVTRVNEGLAVMWRPFSEPSADSCQIQMPPFKAIHTILLPASTRVQPLPGAATRP